MADPGPRKEEKMAGDNEKDEQRQERDDDRERQSGDPVTLLGAEVTIQDIRRIVAKLKEDKAEE